MSSFALTSVVGLSASTLDDAFTAMTSQTGETTVQFGDGVHGAVPPHGSNSTLGASYAAGGGASGHGGEVKLQPPAHRSLLDHTSATGFFQSEASDEVVVAFAPGDVRYPVIAGPLWNSADKPPTSRRAADADRVHPHSAQSTLDSMSKMGETESLRLQMAMDRLSKMMSTLSNILQKITTTEATITQNIK
jgi:hypothetical protein